MHDPSRFIEASKLNVGPRSFATGPRRKLPWCSGPSTCTNAASRANQLCRTADRRNATTAQLACELQGVERSRTIPTRAGRHKARSRRSERTKLLASRCANESTGRDATLVRCSLDFEGRRRPVASVFGGLRRWRAAGLLVAQAPQYFEHLAAGRKHPAAAPLVLFQRPHELDFFVRIIAFARCRVDLSPAVYLRSSLQLASLDGYRLFLGTAIRCFAAILRTAADGHFGSCFFLLVTGFRHDLTLVGLALPRNSLRSRQSLLPWVKGSTRTGIKVQRLGKIAGLNQMSGLGGDWR